MFGAIIVIMPLTLCKSFSFFIFFSLSFFSFMGSVISSFIFLCYFLSFFSYFLSQSTFCLFFLHSLFVCRSSLVSLVTAFVIIARHFMFIYLPIISVISIPFLVIPHNFLIIINIHPHPHHLSLLPSPFLSLSLEFSPSPPPMSQP